MEPNENKISKYGIALVVVLVILGIVFLVYRNSNKGTESDDTENVACTMEAKICPDGSSVGRSGPKCEFALCPGEVQTVAGDLNLSVGEKSKIGDLEVTLNKITEDSRCPKGVTCIWEGAVGVEVSLKTRNKSETVTLSSTNQDLSFDGYLIRIGEVTPQKEQNVSISPDDYQITFRVQSLNREGK